MRDAPAIMVVVPARAASTRFPGKPLAILTNRNGVAKPLIEWTWDAAVRAVGRDAALIATDDQAIAAPLVAMSS
jgi:3-deoxy-manno-octulosonate cytidylyltransferase (CMP-KDO synthetase)